MKNVFQKNKKKLLTILAILSLLSVAWIILTTKKQKAIVTPTPTPTGIPLEFKLLRTNPAYGEGAQIIDTNAIDFKFSKPIDVSSLIISITPEINYYFETDEEDRLLYIIPQPKWETKKLYNISIKVKSKDGESLSKSIDYKLQIEPITTSELTEQFFTPEPSIIPEP